MPFHYSSLVHLKELAWRNGALHDNEPTDWHAMNTVKDWWVLRIQKGGRLKKAMNSLVMLVPCEIWKEGNAASFETTFLALPCLCWRSKMRQHCGISLGKKI
jgi:hypothetical protein